MVLFPQVVVESYVIFLIRQVIDDEELADAAIEHCDIHELSTLVQRHPNQVGSIVESYIDIESLT